MADEKKPARKSRREVLYDKSSKDKAMNDAMMAAEQRAMAARRDGKASSVEVE